MGLLQRLTNYLGITSKRSHGGDPFPNFRFDIGGSGRISEHLAHSLSAYWRGVQLLSESTAMLPVKVIRKNANGDKEEIESPITRLLNFQANENCISFQYTQVLISSVITWGNGYAIIDRDNVGNPTELINVHYNDVEILRFQDEIFYKVTAAEHEIIISKEDMIHVKGYGTNCDFGLSRIQQHAENLGISLGAQKYGKKFFDKGTFIDGYISMATVLKPDVKKAIAEQWQLNYGIGGIGGTAILDAGTEYTRLGMPPADAQWLETRKFQNNETARIVGVPPHMLYDLENATFSNIEHQQIEYLTYSLRPYIERLEQEYHSKLLREQDKQNTQIKHEVADLLRTDIKSQGEYFKILFETGAMSPNDIRRALNMNPTPDGDIYTIQWNRGTLKQIKDGSNNADRNDSGNGEST